MCVKSVRSNRSKREAMWRQIASWKCHWLQCEKPPRVGSKYCSEECGMALATLRLQTIFPSRLESWRDPPPRAISFDERQLVELSEKHREIALKLKAVEQRAQELKELVDKAKSMPIDPNAKGEEPEHCESIYCVSCGAELIMRTALKHMERCYHKSELLFIGTPFPDNITGVLCNKFDSKYKTFCKRLKVLCGEHHPDLRTGVVCGFPLVTSVFNPTGKYCQLDKNDCYWHIGWEKLRRAEIDNEKLRLFLEFIEVTRKKELIQGSLERRGSVMDLLLHQTIDHALEDPPSNTRENA